MPSDRATHLIAELPDETVRRRSFFRSFLRFLGSNIGLVVLVALYSVGGAYLFNLLEQYIELQNCQQGYLSENISISEMSQAIYTDVAWTYKDNASLQYAQIEKRLNNFTQEIYTRRSDLRYTGQNCEESSGWSIASSLLFAITVITTIGYGHISPTSWEGQITCICYALIGIPIFLLCVSSISAVLGDIFRFMYSGLLHCFCGICRTYSRNRRRRMRRLRAGKIKSAYDSDCVGTATLDPSWPEAHGRYERPVIDDENPVEQTRRPEQSDSDDDDDDEKDEHDDIWDRMESRVPFGAVILIFFGYIFLGAFMFNRFEGWPMTVSVYFCYITLATVGFGDYVPGITSGSTSGLRFVLASLYILFGLSILAMCFDLIKEGIVDKFRWFANKIGIIADEDDQVDNDRTRYANFEYDTSTQNPPRRETPVQPFVSRMKSNDSLGEPPAYDEAPNDGSWSNNFRDKGESSSQTSIKKMSKSKDEKH